MREREKDVEEEEEERETGEGAREEHEFEGESRKPMSIISAISLKLAHACRFVRSAQGLLGCWVAYVLTFRFSWVLVHYH